MKLEDTILQSQNQVNNSGGFFLQMTALPAWWYREATRICRWLDLSLVLNPPPDRVRNAYLSVKLSLILNSDVGEEL